MELMNSGYPELSFTLTPGEKDFIRGSIRTLIATRDKHGEQDFQRLVVENIDYKHGKLILM